MHYTPNNRESLSLISIPWNSRELLGSRLFQRLLPRAGTGLALFLRIGLDMYAMSSPYISAGDALDTLPL